jgi:hypothetical protein
MAANEGWRPSERLRINKHHGWRASKPSRMAGRISGCDSERVRKLANLGCRASQRVWKAKRISGRDSQWVWKAANRRFRASFRPLTSNHRSGHRSPSSRKEADSGGRPADRWRFSTGPKASLSQAEHRTDDERFRPFGRRRGGGVRRGTDGPENENRCQLSGAFPLVSFVGCVESSEHTTLRSRRWCVPKTPHTLRDSNPKRRLERISGSRRHTHAVAPSSKATALRPRCPSTAKIVEMEQKIGRTWPVTSGDLQAAVKALTPPTV